MDGRNVLEVLEGQRYARLSTFRKSGAAVPTPVWFARVGGVLYVVTGRNSGKVKRIRNNPDVLMAPCDARGRPKGADAAAVARLTSQRKGDPADRALLGKYGWQYRLFGLVERLRGSADELVFVEFRPRGGAAGR